MHLSRKLGYTQITKPWVTREIKEAINKKKLAFKSKNRQQLLSTQKELKYTIKKTKAAYKNKIEKHFESNNMKWVWEGMNLMSGCKSKGTTDLKEGTGLMQMILISFTLDLIAMTSEKKRKMGLVFCLFLRTGTGVKEYRYQRTKCFGI